MGISLKENLFALYIESDSLIRFALLLAEAWMVTLRYRTKGADTFERQPDRCPVCKYPLTNGFQLTCEPGVCMYREKPVYYRIDEQRRIA